MGVLRSENVKRGVGPDGFGLVGVIEARLIDLAWFPTGEYQYYFVYSLEFDEFDLNLLEWHPLHSMHPHFLMLKPFFLTVARA